MPKYKVYSNEVVFYETIVEANSEREAIDKIYNGEVEVGDATDGQDFGIEFAELVKEDEND